MAAHHLHREALKWDEEGNEIIQAAKKMAILFAKMSQFMRCVLDLSLRRVCCDRNTWYWNLQFHDTFHCFLRDAEEGQPQRSKKELIALAKEIAAASKEVSAYSAKVAKNCPDKRVGQVRSEQRGKGTRGGYEGIVGFVNGLSSSHLSQSLSW